MALLHALDFDFPRVGVLSRTVQSVCDSAEGSGFTGGAGLKGAPVLVHVPRDEEGVALSVTKTINDGATQTALLADGLLQRLRLAPVHA